MLALCATLPVFAADLSLLGHSGLLRVPHAETALPGQFQAGINSLDQAPSLSDRRSYAINLGLYPWLEINGRLVEITLDVRAVSRDLTAGAKIQLRQGDGSFLPAVAVGVQDLQGNQLLQTYYATTSWSWRSLRLTGGYGWRSELLSGAFAGLDWTPLPWLQLLAEHSDAADSAGLRARMPLGRGIFASATWVQDFGRATDRSYGFTLSIPLDLLSGPPPPTPLPAVMGTAPSPQAEAVEPPPAPSDSVPASAPSPPTIACFHDTARYRKPVDALAAALAAPAGGTATPTTAVLRREGASELGATLSQAGQSDYFFAESDACSAQGPSPSRPVELVLEPNLVTFVATDLGTLDADLSLRARLDLPLLPQVTMAVSVLTPSLRSDDFEPEGNFGSQRSRAGLDQLLVQHYAKAAPAWHVLTSAGQMRVLGARSAALLNEQTIFFSDGRHLLRTNAGLFADTDRRRGLAILDYRYQLPRAQTSFGLGGGRFVAGDRGLRADVTRFFGDTAVSLFVRYAGSGNDAAGGMGISLPLMPRTPHSTQSALLVRGSERWGHSLQSTFGGSSGSNLLRPALLVDVLPDRNLRDTYLDYFRASPAWLEQE